MRWGPARHCLGPCWRAAWRSRRPAWSRSPEPLSDVCVPSSVEILNRMNPIAARSLMEERPVTCPARGAAPKEPAEWWCGAAQYTSTSGMYVSSLRYQGGHRLPHPTGIPRNIAAKFLAVWASSGHLGTAGSRNLLLDCLSPTRRNPEVDGKRPLSDWTAEV